jgi:hypothetical protein
VSSQGDDGCAGPNRHPSIMGSIDTAFGKHSDETTAPCHLDCLFGGSRINSTSIGWYALKTAQQ